MLEVGTRRQQRFGPPLGASIPRADGLADVTSGEMGADRRFEGGGDLAAVLDREVRDAAACVELGRRGEGSGGASLQAGGTGAAVTGRGLVRGQPHRREELAEEKLRAELRVDQAGILADPPEPCALRQLALEHRRSVDGGPPGRAGNACREEAPEAGQPALDDAVVVLAAGIARDDDAIARRVELGRLGHVVVAQRHADDGGRSGEEAPGLRARCDRLGQPPHLAVRTVGDPALESLGAGQRIGGGQANQVEVKLVERERLESSSELVVHVRILRPEYTAGVLIAPLFAVAAVLTSDRVVFADTGAGKVLRDVVLPAPAAAIFAAPDGRVVLPLAGADETVVVATAGSVERWPGRVFPVFFDESDRMQIVLPELLLVASYPERLAIVRVPIPGLKAPWRTVSTANGLMAAICATPSERRLVVAITEPGALQREVRLAGEPRALAMAPRGEWVAIGLANSVQAVIGGEPQARLPLSVDGSVRALAASADGRDVVVGTASDGGGSLVFLRVNAKAERGMKARGLVRLASPVEALAAAGDEVLAVAGDSLLVLAKRGRKLVRTLPIPGARQVVVLPARPASIIPQWSETPPS